MPRTAKVGESSAASKKKGKKAGKLDPEQFANYLRAQADFEFCKGLPKAEKKQWQKNMQFTSCTLPFFKGKGSSRKREAFRSGRGDFNLNGFSEDRDLRQSYPQPSKSVGVLLENDEVLDGFRTLFQIAGLKASNEECKKMMTLCTHLYNPVTGQSLLKVGKQYKKPGLLVSRVTHGCFTKGNLVRLHYESFGENVGEGVAMLAEGSNYTKAMQTLLGKRSTAIAGEGSAWDLSSDSEEGSDDDEPKAKKRKKSKPAPKKATKKPAAKKKVKKKKETSSSSNMETDSTDDDE